MNSGGEGSWNRGVRDRKHSKLHRVDPNGIHMIVAWNSLTFPTNQGHKYHLQTV